MTKLQILIVCVAFTIGCCFFFVISNSTKTAEKPLQPRDFICKLSTKGKVVFAKGNLAVGRILSFSDVSEIEVQINKIPRNALRSMSNIEGRVLNKRIRKGELISELDLVPQAELSDRLHVRAKTLIPKGKIIELDELEFGAGTVTRPINAIEYVGEAAGLRASRDIPAKTIITHDDFIFRKEWK